MKSKIRVTIMALLVIVMFLGACVYKPVVHNEKGEEETYSTESVSESETDIWSSSAEMCREVKEKLESKGWKDIRLIEGWGDWEIYDPYGTLVELTEEEKNMTVYTVWGQREDISAVVRVAFDGVTPEGRIYKVFYKSVSGRYFDSAEDNEILSAEDEELLDFMHSY